MNPHHYRLNMSITVGEFKTYLELAIEISGAMGVLGYLVYRLDVVRSIWRVSRGRANSADIAVALEAVASGFAT